MRLLIWVIVFSEGGEQVDIVRCKSDYAAENAIYHNKFYGRRCLKVRVKGWR